MPNRLIHEKSPYLLQHAHNPVDWYPWGEEAFERARREDKPIFLSIGYSTCHWCHVMEKESFEDPEVASLMNATFVNIKVDREERPDVDQIYMTVCQMTTGSGGWPLTILMTPDRKPFLAATYIPKESRYGRVGMKELIGRIGQLWSGQREKLLDSAQKVTQTLQQMDHKEPGAAVGEDLLHQAYEQLSLMYDETHGGFGQSPKFPTPHQLTFLLRYHVRTQRRRAREMVEKTLARMRLGGIYDQVGYGFHRYATDRAWLVPHFEKMLYDQALLALAYTEAYQLTREPLYRRTAEEVLAYVQRDLTDPEGGFYASEDADSEGEEGKFYLWSEADLAECLGGEDFELAKVLFCTEAEGNFYDEATRRRTGHNILHLARPLAETAKARGQDVEALLSRVERIRQTLFAARQRRVRPARDDKVLADWNGLAIGALARAAFVFHEDKYAQAAEGAVSFLEKHLTTKEGGLLHRFRDGEAAIPGFLDDYAFLAWGLIELYEATFDLAWLRRACELADRMIALFWDEEPGGFFFTVAGCEDLIVRRKETYDGAVPSGNAVAAQVLLRLSRMTQNTNYEEKGHKTLSAFSAQLAKSPAAYTQLLQALDFALGPSLEIVLAGPAERVRLFADVLRGLYLPGKVVLGKIAPSKGEDLGALAPFTAGLPIREEGVAYVCRNFACEAPCLSPEELEAKLREPSW